jgi:hypothetical protein
LKDWEIGRLKNSETVPLFPKFPCSRKPLVLLFPCSLFLLSFLYLIMTEWEYQDIITARYLTQALEVDNREFYLIAWEIMFPSWRMNDKKRGRWEKSIDFMFFDLNDTFLLLELKAKINTSKQFEKAKHQLESRVPLFISSYSEENLYKIINDCRQSYRAHNIPISKMEFHFPRIQNIKMLPYIGAPIGKFTEAYMPNVDDPELKLWWK